jgi:hypothetical protein
MGAAGSLTGASYWAVDHSMIDTRCRGELVVIEQTSRGIRWKRAWDQ